MKLIGILCAVRGLMTCEELAIKSSVCGAPIGKLALRPLG